MRLAVYGLSSGPLPIPVLTIDPIGPMSWVNSSGMTNFVAGPVPSALRASRYCSAIVFWSMPLAASKIVWSALAEALGAQDRGLAVALGAQDRRLLVALGDVDGGLARALGLGDDGAPGSFGRELPVHGLLHRRRRQDLADLDGRDLAAPALGDFVELQAQRLVDLLPLRQHVVERDVADDGPERRRRDALQGAGEVGDVDRLISGSTIFQ